MSDTQLLTIALSTVPTVIVVMIGILLNNSRLSDLRQDVLGRIADLRAEMDRRFAAIERRLDSVEAKIDLLTGKVIEFDNRFTRVEAHLGLESARPAPRTCLRHISANCVKASGLRRPTRSEIMPAPNQTK